MTPLLNAVIKYKTGYQYQLAEDYAIRTGIFPAAEIREDFISMDRDGLLTIKKGYAWDGASGIAIDTADFMRGSLVHDVLYQLMQDGKLSQAWRKPADELLVQLCREDGMGDVRSWYVLKAVRAFGKQYAAARNDSDTVKSAP